MGGGKMKDTETQKEHAEDKRQSALSELDGESHAKAWGQSIEEWAAKAYPIELDRESWKDAVTVTEGTPVEIKSARKCVKNGIENGKQTYTSGRITIRKKPHYELVKNGGRYLFVVYRPDELRTEGAIFRSMMKDAREVTPMIENRFCEKTRRDDEHARLSWKRIIDA